MIRFLAAAAFFLAFCFPGQSQPGEVSRTPPDIYKKEIASLLTHETNLEDARRAFPDSTDRATVVLDENIYYVDSHDTRYRVFHKIYLSRTEAGAEANAQDVVPFNQSRDTPHFILAQTIDKDGTVHPVVDNAVFIQTPQYYAQDSLYTDQAELVIVYPRVEPGCLTEFIVLLEETPIIPQELSVVHSFEGNWPIYSKRCILDVPAALAPRINILPTGISPPDAKRSDREGRTQWSWESNKRNSLSWEASSPSLRFKGSTVWVTSMEDWSSFASWFRGLLQDRTSLEPDLEASLNEWTSGVTERRQIANILHEKVANEVRYTGLEFGIAGYQPASCQDVWKNKYGDCKDKANLLASMLRKKGITAHIALLNTSHAGQVEKRSPSPQQFDHAIVAVEQEDGTYIFSDPTISYSSFGALGPSDTNREVLVIGPKVHKWVKTPEESAGSLEYTFDLELLPSGELNGWFGFKASGTYGSWYRDDFTGVDTTAIYRRLSSIMEPFFPAAQLIDAEVVRQDGMECEVRGYLLLPSTVQENTEDLRLRFPRLDNLLHGTTYGGNRTTPYWQRVQDVTIGITVKLPDQSSATQLPREYLADTPALFIRGLWEKNQQSLTSTVVYSNKKSNVVPQEYALLYRATKSLQSWLEKTPVVVGSPDQGLLLESSEALDSSRFPVMPSGSGQLALLQERYPEGKDNAKREAALRQTLQWFPDDPSTCLDAEVYLIQLNREEKSDAECAERYEAIARKYGETVPRESLAWVESLRALALSETQMNEAILVLKKLALDESLSDYRRGWCAYQTGIFLAPSRDDATDWLLATEDISTELREDRLSQLLALLTIPPMRQELAAVLAQVLEDKNLSAESILTDASTQILKHEKTSRKAIDLIVATLTHASESGRDLNSTIQEFRALQDREALILTCKNIASALKKRLASKRPSWFIDPPLEPLPLDKLAAKITDTKTDLIGPQLFSEWLHYLTMYPPHPDTFPYYFWLGAVHLNLEKFDDDLLTFCLPLSDQLPRSVDQYYELQLVKTDYLRRTKEEEKSAEILVHLLEEETTSPAYRIAAAKRLGELHAHSGELIEAARFLRFCEINPETNSHSYDALFEAVLVNLELGNRNEALRILKIIEDLEPDVLDTMVCKSQASRLMAMTANHLSYLEHQEKWWQSWVEIAEEHRLPLEDHRVPTIENYLELEQNLLHSSSTRDGAQFLRFIVPLVSSARYIPDDLVHACRLFARIIPSMHSQSSKLIQLTHLMLADFSTPHELLGRNARLYYAVLSLNAPAPRLSMIRDDVQKYGYSDDTGAGMTRIWALAALGANDPTHIAESAQALEGLLSHDNSSQRANAVRFLSQLYARQNKTNEEKELLERETQNSVVQANPATLQLLTGRLEQLRGLGSEASDFTKAVTSWITEHGPPWYDFARPSQLDQVKMESLDEVIADATGRFLPPEKIKILFLAASDSSRPIESRQIAFMKGLQFLNKTLIFRSDRRQLHESVINHTEFNDEIRAAGLSFQWIDAIVFGNKEAPTDFQNHPLFPAVNPTFLEIATKLAALAELPRTNPSEVEAVFDHLIKLTLDTYNVAELNNLIRHAILLEDMDRAQRLIGRTKDIKLTTDQNPIAVRFSFSQTLTSWKQLYPAYSSMRQMVLARYPADVRKPAPMKELASTRNLTFLPDDQERDIHLYKLSTGSFNDGLFKFFSDLCGSIFLEPGGPEMTLSLFQTAAEHAPADSGLVGAMMLIDASYPEHHTPILATLTKASNRLKTPFSRDNTSMMRGLIKWQTDGVEDVRPFISQGASLPAFVPACAQLSHALQRGGPASIGEAFNAFPPEVLLSPETIYYTFRAANELGMTGDLNPAREELEKQIYRNILASWATFDGPSILKVFRLASLLSIEEPYPQEWLQTCRNRCKNKTLLLRMELRRGMMRKDWPTVLQTSSQLLDQRPHEKSLNWPKALSLHHLGRSEESADLLDDYLRNWQHGDQLDAVTKLAKEIEKKESNNAPKSAQKKPSPGAKPSEGGKF